MIMILLVTVRDGQPIHERKRVFLIKRNEAAEGSR
jgi:hypothetical protein